MRLKTIRSLLFLSLAIILFIGGVTMAWFTAEFDLPSAAEMVTGAVSFEIADASVYSEEGRELEGEAIGWQAGEGREFRWTIKNTGSREAFFRARAESALTQFGEHEDAWGGSPGSPLFTEKGNQAMYLTHDRGGTGKAILFAGEKNLNVGVVKVQEEAGRLHVGYETQNGWFLTATHLVLADVKEGLPTNPGGSLVPGKFPYKNNHNMVPEYSYALNLPGYNPVYLAAYAKVAKGAKTAGEGKITWSLPDGSAWMDGSDGWFYYRQPIEKGEEITLGINGSLAENAEGGICRVELQAEAVQVSHGAADAEWPGRPQAYEKK